MGNGASVEGESTEQLDLTTTKAIAGDAFDAGRFEAVAFVNDAGHKVVTRGALQAQAALADVTFAFSDEQFGHMVDHFSEFDIDHDGAISRADLAIVMQSLGSAADAETLTTMISQVVGGDVTDASTITFKDYAAHMAKKWTPGRPPTVTPGALPEDAGGQFKRVFDIIDRDRDGKITQADVDHFVKLWGDEWSSVHQELAEEVMEFADEDKSGVISYADFVRVLRQPSFSSLPSRASRASKDGGGGGGGGGGGSETQAAAPVEAQPPAVAVKQ